jgi:hypothetical protein
MKNLSCKKAKELYQYQTEQSKPIINKQINCLSFSIERIFKSKLRKVLCCLSSYSNIYSNKSKCIAVLSGLNLRNKIKSYFNLLRQNSKLIYHEKV